MKRRLPFALAAAALLAGCGGGIVIGFGPSDDPPSVSLATSVASAAPGQALTLSAAASDDDFVIAVDFYRIDPSGNSVFLGGDRNPPWQLGAVMPAGLTSGATVYFFARATDSIGQQSDSALVAVTVP